MPFDISVLGCSVFDVVVLRSPSRLDFNPELTSHVLDLLIVCLYFNSVLNNCCARTLPGRMTLMTTFCTLH